MNTIAKSIKFIGMGQDSTNAKKQRNQPKLDCTV